MLRISARSVNRNFQLGMLLMTLCVNSIVHGAELEAQLDGVLEQVAIETPVFAGESDTTVYWQREVQKFGAEYLRLHVASVEVPPGQEIVLELRDRGGQHIRNYSGQELQERGSFWTGVIPGDYVLLSLFSDNVPIGFKLKIDQIVYQAYAGAPLSTWGVDEKRHVAEYSDSPIIAGAERPVAKLLFLKGGAPRVCTGFLIGQNELMTNHHCVNDQAICNSVIAIFGYQLRQDGRLDFGEQYECAKVDPAKMDFVLDYAVLEMRGNPGIKWGALELASADPEKNQALFIVQHPAGQPKQISQVNCGALGVPVEGRGTATDFTHTCDTVGGSSGSPVFDQAGRVIGLHHYGFGEGKEGDWTENRAVRMLKIVADLSD